jgi:diguanylate cyclase (GGDEF)-like protein/PAS domain S-box-containing protein
MRDDSPAGRFLRQIVDLVPHFIFAKDADGRFVLVNQAVADTYGVTVAEMQGKTDADFAKSPTEAIAFRADDLEVIASGRSKVIPAELITDSSGVERILHTTKIPFAFEDGSLGLLGVSTDITARRRDQARIEFLAHHDSLTELPNRSQLEEFVQRSQQTTSAFTLLFIDLDNFKDVNDSHGHSVGDTFLKFVSRRLRQALPASDFICRAGGDEFIVVLCDITPGKTSLRIEQLLVTISEPITIDSMSLSISGSVGAARFPDDGKNVATLMKHADAALYAAKAKGRNTFAFFSPTLRAAAARRLAVINGLRTAIARRELTLHFQPIIDAVSRRWTGAEALLRWHSAELGAVSPVEFIPLAEESGIIHSIGMWVATQACAAQARWSNVGVDIHVSINVSPKQLLVGAFDEKLRAACVATGARLDRLTVELTEGVFLADADASRMLRSLADSGVGIAIDDFGVGYSSLGYLRKLPLSHLKIDRTFVNDCTTNADDATIIRSIIGLATNLRLKVVAEGVETREQATFLTAQGCHELQGYLFSRPVPEQAAMELLAPQFSTPT